MSKASDISAFEHSVEPAPAETLFRDKKWTYIQDSTSNNGQYSGQIQFNLSTISSQAAFVNWEEAIIELPIKLEIKNATGSPVTSTAACTIDQLVSKAGAWQFIDSVQVVIDGTTVQTNQIHENVNATFKALTEWDYNTYLKQGQTSNFVIDEYSAPAAGSTLTQNIDNVTTSSYMNNVVALDQQSNKLAYDIMGSTANIQAVSKPQVYVAPAGTVAAGGSFYVAHYLACIKLKDICDYFKKCPMQKNTRGFIYINYNSSSTTITVNITGTVAPGTISVSNNMNYGNTCPILWNFYSAVSTATLTPTGLAVPSSTVLTVTADVNGIPTSGSGNAPIWNNPVNFGYDLFVQEMSKSVIDGGLDDVTSAGLLSQRLWESLYRFVAVDIGRRLPSEDGASKSIIVSGTNNTNYALTIYYHVLREVVASVDTATGTVSQVSNMNGFFTDNQTKQKAYDRYYNEMAKNDFVQGAKLKAMIQQQALDEASSDSLANLFQQVMSKSRDYDYDKITSKLTKKAPPVIKGEEDKKKPKAFTYVPEQTDTHKAPEESQFSYEEAINDENFKKYMDEMDYTKLRKGIDLEKAVQSRVKKYLKKNKEFRNKIFQSNRKATKDEINDKATEIAKVLLKRKREAPASNEASPNLRPKSRIKQEELSGK
ncbi:hypothetical protein GQ600_26290 [Phytophthora cactorum]|nr:hypothetical protein GQ600_26290 [Phytophthora cactorum]